MKKIFIFPLILILVSIVLPFGSVTKANEILSQDQKIAYVTLPDDLHPDYAPVISIDNSAQKNSSDPQDRLKAAANYGNYFLQLIAGGLLYLAGPAAILVIAIAGLRYVTSHGDQNQMDGAKKTLTYAIVGLIVIILSFAIIKAIIGAALTIG